MKQIVDLHFYSLYIFRIVVVINLTECQLVCNVFAKVLFVCEKIFHDERVCSDSFDFMSTVMKKSVKVTCVV